MSACFLLCHFAEASIPDYSTNWNINIRFLIVYTYLSNDHLSIPKKILITRKRWPSQFCFLSIQKSKIKKLYKNPFLNKLLIWKQIIYIQITMLNYFSVFMAVIYLFDWNNNKVNNNSYALGTDTWYICYIYLCNTRTIFVL